MKRGEISRWTDIESCKNLLFLGQLVNELLFDYSIPSNRISTLNSHSLCQDAITTIKTIEENGVPEGSLKPIVEELFRALSKDVTFDRRNENPLKYFLKPTANGKYVSTQRPDDLSYEDSKKVVNAPYQKYFQSGWYIDALVEDVRELVKGNDEDDLLSLFRQTKSLLTQWVNCGYSSRYIYLQTQRILFSSLGEEICADTIDEWLGLFDCSEKQYDVVFIVNKDHRYFLQTIQRLELHSEEIPKRGDSDSEAWFIQSKRKKEWFVMPQKAKDPFSAAENRIRMLADKAAIYRMSDHNYRFDLSQLRCGVYDDRGTFYYLNDETSPVQRIKTPNRETINKNSNRVGAAIETAVNRHHVHEAFALLNAIRAHSLSLDSDSDKNQLLDLWSIFETILDISNKHTSDRIQQVCLYLVPILKRKYFYSLFAQLANDIRIYSSETYDSIVEGETDEFKAVKKLVEYVLLDERKAERDVFLAACSDFPLLKERVEYYHLQLCTPVKINEFAEKHAERVRWQVMRIYRNRNMIIHNGESSTYLKLLVENLHSYVDDFIDYVVQAVLRGFDHRTMSQELFVKECEWREAFDNKKAVLDSELIEKMLQI